MEILALMGSLDLRHADSDKNNYIRVITSYYNDIDFNEY